MKYTAIEKAYKNCKVTVKRYEDGIISLDVYDYHEESEKCIFSMDLTDDVVLMLSFITNSDNSYLAELIEDMYNKITL